MRSCEDTSTEGRTGRASACSLVGRTCCCIRFRISLSNRHALRLPRALREGERIWVMAKMPQAMEIVRGDECFKCLLQLAHTFRRRLGGRELHSDARGRPEHADAGDGRRTKNLPRAAQQTDAVQAGRTRGVHGDHARCFLRAEELFKRLAKVQMNENRLEHYLGAVFPRSDELQKKLFTLNFLYQPVLTI